MDSVDGRISEKYLEHEEVNELEKGRPLVFFKKFAKEQKKLRSEIMMLNQITMTEEHEDALIPHVKGETSHLNRYSDILPYKHSAVSLDQEGGKDCNDYINANYIPGPFGEQNIFIASQGPKHNTIKDFWRMIRQQNVSLILMLCRLEEGGRPKCDQYWPDHNESLKYDDISLEIKSESEKAETQNLLHREFSLIDTSNNETISTVRQIQYSGWPDHGLPDKEEFEDFDTLVEYTMNEYNKIRDEQLSRKILFHCSAGIGRTGTLLSIVHAIAHIEKLRAEEKDIESISVFSTVRKLREHRFHLVQTDGQYFFIYEYLAKYLKKVNLL